MKQRCLILSVLWSETGTCIVSELCILYVPGLNHSRHVVSPLSICLSIPEFVYHIYMHWPVKIGDMCSLEYFCSYQVRKFLAGRFLFKFLYPCGLFTDIQPSPDVLEHCAAFLLNVKDWSYLINLDNTNSGHLEVLIP